jgi:hypothetical protein
VFYLVCFWCHKTIKSWKNLGRAFSDLLEAASKLESESSSLKISDRDLHAAVAQLNFPKRTRAQRARAWDIYATLRILFSLKSGGSRGNLIVKSKTLERLIRVAMYPSMLRAMPSSSQKRYEFVLYAITG